MNPDPIEILPTCRWIDGWRIRASAWTASESWTPDAGFKTLGRAGELAPALEDADWSFHPGFDPSNTKVDVRLFANGYSLSASDLSRPCCLSVFTPAPGVLIGFATQEIHPRLFSPEREAREIGRGVYVLEATDANVMLHVKPRKSATLFCLMISAEDQGTLFTRTRSVLDADPDRVIAAELDKRVQYWKSRPEEAPRDEMGAHALEELVASLQAPTSSIPWRWCATPPTPPYTIQLNELLVYVLAWQEIDPTVAEELIRSAFSFQQKNGRLPAWANPGGTCASYPCWPLLSQLVLLHWQKTGDEDLREFAVPRLFRHLSWCVDYFDTAKVGIRCWQSHHEAFVPETYDKELATADLTAFLLSDIEAFLTLYSGSRFDLDLGPLQECSEQLTRDLHEFFWHEELGCFMDRYVGKEPISRKTLSSIMPMFWTGLSNSFRRYLVDQLVDRKTFRARQGIRLWQEWPSDETPAPVMLLHQAFVIHALDLCQAQTQMWELSRLLLESMHGAYQRTRMLPDRLLPDTAGNDEESPPPALSTSALVVFLSGIGKKETVHAESPVVRWMDRHRLSMLGLPIGIIALATLVIVITFHSKKHPPLKAALSDVGLAQRYYEEGDYLEAIEILSPLVGTKVENSAVLALLGKSYYRIDDFKRAEELLHSSLEKADSPQTKMNLALSQYRSGKLEAARATYQSFIEAYGESYTNMAYRARIALELIGMESDAPQALSPIPFKE